MAPALEKPRQSILVVDDIADNITVLGATLAPLYEVRVATSGLAALKIATSEAPPDLVLLDIMMPGMDGYEVCRQLKADPKTASIPVIFVTSKSEDVDEELGLEVGAVDYLSKPVRPVIVRARVKNHLNLAAAKRSLAKQNEILQENLKLREEIEQISRHDLKNPLSAFFAATELLKRGTNLTPVQQNYLAILDRSSHRMLEMINRSLDLSRMERGTYRLEAVPVDLVTVIRGVFSQFGDDLADKSLRAETKLNGREVCDGDEFMVPGEEYLYFSLFSNLVKNAIEASPLSGEIVVTMREDAGFEVAVANAGTIPLEVRERFFTKYATFGKASGTGLGAYSARLMARTLGGDLSFTTSAESGTILVFRLARTGKSARAEAL